MPEFLSPLVVKYLNGFNWELAEPLRYKTDKGIVEVPKDYVTDFASIPRLLWVLLPPTGRSYGKAAVIHDYLYTYGGQIPNSEVVFSKRDADRIFLEAMRLLGVRGIKRTIMYWAVRLFGKGSF